MKNSRKKKICLILTAVLALNVATSQIEKQPCILPEETSLEDLLQENKENRGRRGR